MGRPFSRKDISLSFGLVTETVRLTGAINKDAALSLKSLCVGQGTAEHAATPISSVYQCPSCGPITDRESLVKGHDTGDGWAIVTGDDIKELKADTSEQFKKKIALTAHPADQVLNSTQSGSKVYYLEPQAAGDRFAIIRDLIANHPQYAFVAQYTVTSNVATYVARVSGTAIVLEERVQLDLNDAPVVEGETNKPMYDMAAQLLGQMVVDFDASTYADTYTERLREMLDAANVVEGAEAPEGSKPRKKASDDELMAALQAQLEAQAS
jgi:non-homologous end joining protein Ku